MNRGVPLTIALPDYHHARALVSGAVTIAGVAPTFAAPGDGEADVFDRPLPDHLRAFGAGDDRFTAVPVFPARAFAPGVGPADYLATGIYPIRTVLVARRAVLEEHRWLATNLYRAFEVARRTYFERLGDIRGSRAPIPSVAAHIARLRGILGPELCPYGVEPNRAALEAAVADAAAAGVLPTPPADVAELFAPVEPFVDFTDGV